MSTELMTTAIPPADSDPKIGRKRLLTTMGAALFAFVADDIVRKSPAWALDPPPGPCYGLGRCPCCSGSTCTCATCGYYGNEGCPNNGQCWSACYSNCIWHCCDWKFTEGSTWVSCICGVCVAGRSC